MSGRTAPADVIAQKLRRIATGENPRVLDLFSGCGGLTLGFTRAGFHSIGGIENDPDAARTYALNFHADDPRFLLHRAAKDIKQTRPTQFIRSLGYGDPQLAVDVIVGGPPCPTFTRVGRAKLRDVQQHPEAYKHDPRAQLYVPYLEFVRRLLPIAVVMENVPDFLNWGGHNLAEEIADVLEAAGYDCRYTLLNAANYGVPQMRDRFFLVAVHPLASVPFRFPVPTNWLELPPGYEGSRDVALKMIRGEPRFGSKPRFVATPLAEKTLRPAVTVREAISDLPRITGHLTGDIKRGARRFDKPVAYVGAARISDYAAAMREWPGFEGTPSITDHVIRSLSDRDYRLFRKMKPGDDYPKAHELACHLFEVDLARRRRRGEDLKEGSAAWTSLRRAFIPPYDASKFPNKWRKMEPDAPARTLMAHLGKDSYSHIHFDDEQARVLSVREAARLQSFPDGFRFDCTMNPAFRQIGNAVPPLLSFALANALAVGLGIPRALASGAE